MKRFFSAIVLVLVGIMCHCEKKSCIKQWPSTLRSMSTGEKISVVVMSTVLDNGMGYAVLVGDSEGNIPVALIYNTEAGCINGGQTMHEIVEKEGRDAGGVRMLLLDIGFESHLCKMEDGQYIYIMHAKEDE